MRAHIVANSSPAREHDSLPFARGAIEHREMATSVPRVLPVSRASRVAIIGAGAGGLSAAHALRAAGFTRVTVFEQSDRVGGKCCTIQYDGRSYELGAALTTTAYTNVRSLMREAHLRGTPAISGAFADLDARTVSFRPPVVARAGISRCALEFARLGAEVMRMRSLREPGFAGAHREDDTHEPFGAWAQARGLSAAAKLVEPWFTAFGYGYIDEMPAAYVLKYFALSGPFFELLDGGYQRLWEATARALDVRTGVSLQRIERDERDERDDHAARVRIVTALGDGERAWDFDAVIVASPLPESLALFDASSEERDLFAKVRTNDYRVVLASVRGLPPHRYVFVPEHLGPETCGRVMFWYKRWPDRDVYAFYILERELASTSSIAQVEATVRRFGGEVNAIVLERRWRYFPHVTTSDMRDGFYTKLESLQGRRGTYFIGELPALGTVETVVAYSRALIARHFVA